MRLCNDATMQRCSYATMQRCNYATPQRCNNAPTQRCRYAGCSAATVQRVELPRTHPPAQPTRSAHLSTAARRSAPCRCGSCRPRRRRRCRSRAGSRRLLHVARLYTPVAPRCAALQRSELRLHRRDSKRQGAHGSKPPAQHDSRRECPTHSAMGWLQRHPPASPARIALKAWSSTRWL